MSGSTEKPPDIYKDALRLILATRSVLPHPLSLPCGGDFGVLSVPAPLFVAAGSLNLRFLVAPGIPKHVKTGNQLRQSGRLTNRNLTN